MWLKVGNGYLNLNNVVDIHFLRDTDETPTATVETVSGNVKHYQGREAVNLKRALAELMNRKPVNPVPESPEG